MNHFMISHIVFLHREGCMSSSSLTRMQLVGCASSLWQYVRLFALLGFMVSVYFMYVFVCILTTLHQTNAGLLKLYLINQ